MLVSNELMLITKMRSVFGWGWHCLDVGLRTKQRILVNSPRFDISNHWWKRGVRLESLKTAMGGRHLAWFGTVGNLRLWTGVLDIIDVYR